MNKLESIQKAIEYTQNKDFKNAEKIYLNLLEQKVYCISNLESSKKLKRLSKKLLE